jgi:hypothetical protein
MRNECATSFMQPVIVPAFIAKFSKNAGDETTPLGQQNGVVHKYAPLRSSTTR